MKPCGYEVEGLINQAYLSIPTHAKPNAVVWQCLTVLSCFGFIPVVMRLILNCKVQYIPEYGSNT